MIASQYQWDRYTKVANGYEMKQEPSYSGVASSVSGYDSFSFDAKTGVFTPVGSYGTSYGIGDSRVEVSTTYVAVTSLGALQGQSTATQSSTTVYYASTVFTSGTKLGSVFSKLGSDYSGNKSGVVRDYYYVFIGVTAASLEGTRVSIAKGASFREIGLEAVSGTIKFTEDVIIHGLEMDLGYGSEYNDNPPPKSYVQISKAGAGIVVNLEIPYDAQKHAGFTGVYNGDWYRAQVNLPSPVKLEKNVIYTIKGVGANGSEPRFVVPSAGYVNSIAMGAQPFTSNGKSVVATSAKVSDSVTLPHVIFEVSAIPNGLPSLTLSTLNNRTLYENDTLSIAGTSLDSDASDVIVVKYQIDAGPIHTIKTATSGGVSSSFSKSLTVKNNIMYDGAIGVTNSLTDDMPHILKVWAEDNLGGKSSEQVRTFTIISNRVPTVTLTAPTANQTLYENDTFPIAGTMSDADAGNTVTVRYQVNAETVRSIKAFVSDGTTVETFSKSLTFKSGKLHDGASAITSNLPDGVAHTLKVWATDDQGGTSVISERTFYAVPNRAPSLTVNAPVVSGNIDTDKFTINGSYNDADGNTTTVKYRVNGGNSVQVASGTSGVFDFELSFAQLNIGLNTIVIDATDSYGSKTSKTIKLNKNVVSTEQLRSTARYKILPPTNTAKAVLLWIERDKNLDIDVAISMTMAGEAELFVPLTATESVPIANGSTTYEDTFFYEAASAKDNIIVQIDMTRKSVEVNDKITLISGVLE